MGELDRIRWHCRRGLLELDLVLTRFVEQQLEQLNDAGRSAFESLLELPDNDLLDMVMGRAEAPTPAEQSVLELLRRC